MDAVDAKHKDYDKYKKIWDRVIDFSEGQDAVKSKRTDYLPMSPSHAKPLSVQASIETGYKRLYDVFIEKATVWPGTSKTLKAFIGILSRKSPNIQADENLTELFELSGDDVITSASATTERLIQTGISAYLIDWPEDSDRPFAVSYRARDILNWKYAVSSQGMNLVHVSLVDKWEEGEPKEIIHLNLELVQTEDGESVTAYVVHRYEYQQTDSNKMEWVKVGQSIPLKQGQPFDYIPFVPISEGGAKIKYVYPMLSDVANLNMAHYQNDAEYRNALTFAGRPTPCVAGLRVADNQQEITLGSSTILQFDEGGSWGMLGLDDASGINAIRQAGQDLQADMAIAGTRALMSDPAGVEAAQTAAIHREGEHGQLSTVARRVSQGITQALEIMYDWLGLGGSPMFELATDFDPTKLDTQLLNTLWQMYLEGTISFELLWYNMQRGELTPDLRTAIEEREAARADKEERAMANPMLSLPDFEEPDE